MDGFDVTDGEYEMPKSPKSGCSKHCPINRGPCTFYNPITHYCRAHCTSECLLDTPRSCYVEQATHHHHRHQHSLLSSGRRSRRSESRSRSRAESIRSTRSSSSTRSRKNRNENQTYRNHNYHHDYDHQSKDNMTKQRSGPDELEIVLYVLFIIWLFLITSALLQ